MLLITADEARACLSYPVLVDSIARMFTSGCITPVRHHHEMDVPGEAAGTMLLMPAWVPGAYAGVKILNLIPDNHRRSLPTIHGHYLLSDARTGEMLALIEGGELTARRTAATSALASRLLSRVDSQEMLMVGTGRLSINLIEAHAGVRPLSRFHIWGRDGEKAEAIASKARAEGFDARAVTDLQSAAGSADIISCATLSFKPLICGAWLKPGAHLDLVGAFKPDMRESDDDAVRRAHIFVDTRAGAMSEGGDLAMPLASGVLTPKDILADLTDLLTGQHPGRQHDEEITLFKSVGAALEDLAGAILAYETVLRDRQP